MSPNQDKATRKTKEFEGIYADLESLLEMRSAAAKIDFNSRMKSQSMMDGSYASQKRGRGMEFAEVRPYQSGDDIRTIDWRVTARTQETYTKLFQEEKERPTYLVVDQRSSMFFGSKNQFKSYLATKLSAIIAWGTFRNNDSVGAMVFGDFSQSDLRPKRGKRATLRLLNVLSEYNQRLNSGANEQSLNDTGSQTQSLPSILSELRRIARPGSSILIISDFHDFDSQCKQDLSVLSRHCDIDLLHIFDPIEQSLPEKARLTITDGHTNFVLNTHNSTLRKKYTNEWQAFTSNLENSALKARIRFNSISTHTSALDHIIKLYHARAKRGRSS